MQFTRAVPVLTAMSLVTLAAACSGTTTAAPAPGPSTGTGAPAATRPPASAPPTPRATGAPAVAAPQVARPRVQAGRAPVAAGVDVEVRRLVTQRPGGRITGLSRDGVAVGTEGRAGAAPADADAQRAVRWDAAGRKAPLPALAPAADPHIGPGGLIALTTLPAGQDPGDVRRLRGATRVETADGARPKDAEAADVVAVGADRVLVERRAKPGRKAGKDAPSALWSPETGEVTPVPIAGRFLTPEGAVVGDLVTGGRPATTTPATWDDGKLVKLEVPRGWKGEPRAGSGRTVVGKLTQTRAADGGDDDDRAEPAEAAVAWHDGELQYLPPLGGRQSIAAAVNRRGTVVGTSRTPDPDGVPHAVLWRDGRVTDLGTLDGEGESWAVGVSDADVAVGFSATRGGGRHAVAWLRGGIVDLGAAVDPAARSQADGVVGRRVYGRVAGADGADSPVVWTLENDG